MKFQKEEELLEWKQFLRTLNTQSAADRIRMMREHANLSQGQLAEIAGCTANTISQMEKGNILNKETRYLYSICAYFKCSMDWLLCETNQPTFDPRTETIAEYLHLSRDTTQILIDILRDCNKTHFGSQERRRGLNHIVSADPDALSDLCMCLEVFASAQGLTGDDGQPNFFAQYQLGRAWSDVKKIFLAAYEKEKEFLETERKALEETFR